MIHTFEIGNIPAVLYGSSSAGVYLYVHGQHSCKEAARSFASVAYEKGWQVLSIDLPEHGERKLEKNHFFAWEVIPELIQLLNFAKAHWTQSTDILFCEKDNFTSLNTVTRFASNNQCRLTSIKNGEHWFHAEEQLTALNKWTIEVTPRL